ncbi:MAG: hypothetical protein JW937_02315 [Candidatus Omnitrophica bacterium]|nr:hypothetical protein [Candidatus Omnitrophota bacterium]
MLKNLIAFWKGKEFLSQVLGDFDSMLRDGEVMFTEAYRKLHGKETSADLKDRIYSLDREINRLEREIRRRIVEHLSLQPGVDVPACLVLMSVVKDAERLGDYCKNLYEVTELLEKPLSPELLKDYFENTDQELPALFLKAREAFIKSDERAAHEIIQLERTIIKRCDKVIHRLAKSNLETNEAVCMTLLARHLKRLAAHLANITSSVVVPISSLDFFDEKSRHEVNDTSP